MKTRKMYASPGWGDAVTTGFGVRSTPNAFQVVPVLVTDATDMPDFEPGDRVRRALHGDMTGEVVGHPFQNAKTGSWRVPVYVCNEPNYRAWPCAECTKLPRETSVLLRVTGPEQHVGDTVLRMTGGNTEINGCRVERVEEDR